MTRILTVLLTLTLLLPVPVEAHRHRWRVCDPPRGIVPLSFVVTRHRRHRHCRWVRYDPGRPVGFHLGGA